MKRILYKIYQCLIALPIILVFTIITCVSIIVLFPFANSPISYFIPRLWARSICALLFIKVEINGIENAKKNTSCIYACNHQSMLDILLLHGWLPCVFKWVMKSDLRKIPLLGAACRAAGHIFIDRGSLKSKKHMLEATREKLTNGLSVAIFPEGTRTKDGSVGKFKRGAFTLATDLQLPIVPVSIKGAFECMPRNKSRITAGKIQVTFHPIIDTGNYNSENYAELMNECKNAILSGM